MTGKMIRPELSRLRDIAWRCWDALNLKRLGWDEQGGENEYDTYMFRAVEKLQMGETEEDVANYLVEIETDHMQMIPRSDAMKRALATVAALKDL